MLVWKYNDKCYIKKNDPTNDLYAIDKSNETQHGEIDLVEFQKAHPYIMDLPFYRYEFEKDKEVIK